jgi:hypothetical protein
VELAEILTDGVKEFTVAVDVAEVEHPPREYVTT